MDASSLDSTILGYFISDKVVGLRDSAYMHEVVVIYNGDLGTKSLPSVWYYLY